MDKKIAVWVGEDGRLNVSWGNTTLSDRIGMLTLVLEIVMEEVRNDIRKEQARIKEERDAKD